MPWYEPKYGPNSNFLVHFKELDNSQEKKQIEPKQETKSETPNKKLKNNPPVVGSGTKKTVKKTIKKKDQQQKQKQKSHQAICLNKKNKVK